MIQRRKQSLRFRASAYGSAAFAIAALSALAAGGCDDAIEAPNNPGEVVAAGNLSGPVEGCEQGVRRPSGEASSDAGQSDAGQTDAGDAGVSEPSPTGVSISRSGDAVAIPYLIRDPEGDEQRLRVEICRWDGQQASACGSAVQAPGGDGSQNVPTTPAGACVLHVFHWDAGCGRFVRSDTGAGPQRMLIESADQQLVARVSAADSEQDPSQTEPFTLADVGFESVPPCE